MNLACSLTTYNRLDYTKRCVQSWNDTARDDDVLVIVDNGSTDGTAEWLPEAGADLVILNAANLYPGAATNIGWHHALQLADAHLLMRSDNDVEYLPGWRNHIEECFQAFPELGQLGLLNRHEDYDDAQPVTELRRNGVSVNVQWPQVGGNSILPRRLYDLGLRWEAGSWMPGGQDEDSRMSAIVRQNGLVVAEIIPTFANNMSYHRFDDHPDYYRATAAARGLVPEMSV